MINDEAQGSVATYVSCGGIFGVHITTNLLLSDAIEFF